MSGLGTNPEMLSLKRQMEELGLQVQGGGVNTRVLAEVPKLTMPSVAMLTTEQQSRRFSHVRSCLRAMVRFSREGK